MFLVVDAAGYVSVGADTAQVLGAPVQRQAGREPEGDHRQEERHELHDRLLLWIDAGVAVAALQLAVLDDAGGQHDAEQYEVGDGDPQADAQGVAGRKAEVDPQEIHGAGRAQRVVQVSARVQV